MHRSLLRPIILASALVLLSMSAQAADWVVAKTSGETSVSSAQAQPMSLGLQSTLQPGDTIRTGSNGRVLLVRGEETILIGPNTVIGLPGETETNTTTILQQAGSIAVRAQKRDVNHFAVETPFLAAVVKGTEFTVTVDGNTADVQVASGQVQVTDNKSGQVALLLPGQAARALANGQGGLNLRGSGPFAPLQQGLPRKTMVDPISPKSDGTNQPAAKPDNSRASLEPGKAVRIAAPIGSLKLDVSKATNGLVRGENQPSRSKNSDSSWNSNSPNAAPSLKGVANAFNAGNPSGSGLAGANGNAFGLGNGNGNGNAFGYGKGNGKAKGKSK